MVARGDPAASSRFDGIDDGIHGRADFGYRHLGARDAPDAAVRNAKPKGKPYKLTDGGNMYLLVNTEGGRLWRLDYRFQGKRKPNCS